MPSRDRRVSHVVLQEELARNIKEEMSKEHPNEKDRPDFSTYVQHLLWSILDEKWTLESSAPFLILVSDPDSDSMFMKDRKSGDLFEVRATEKGLHCESEDRWDCVHVGYAWANPRVYRILTARGWKRPGIA